MLTSIVKGAREKPDYLPHVDGLRALAVLGVLLYHLDLPFIPGGFVGVDVFFVISGYLITSHIRQSVEAGRFSFRAFYGRRVRRLAPALLMTIAATLVAGFFILPVAGYQSLAKEAIYAVLSISNFLFWGQSGYFDADASLKPLLHTWSLAVEEQYYLLWPLLLVFLRKNTLALLSVLLLGAFSMVAAELLMRRDSAMVFYMMPFRIAEFALGAILYWGRFRQWLNPVLHSWLAAIGLVFIVISFSMIDEQLPFPGVTSLLPCVGAALIITFGQGALVGKLLGLYPILFIGIISYSVYLVHWPIIVFYKYLHVSPLEFKDVVILSLLTFLFAIVQYSLIEYPLRHKSRGLSLSGRQFGVLVSVLAFFIVVVSVSIVRHNGWSWRYKDKQLSAEEIEKGKQRRFEILQANCSRVGWDECRSFHGPKGKRVLVTGDSHAPDALNIFYTAYPDYSYSSVSLGGCPPIAPEDYDLLADTWNDKQKCIDLNRSRLSKEFLQNFDVLVLSVYFDWYRPEHLLNAYQYIQQLVDIPVVIVGNYIALNIDYPELMARNIDPRLREDVVHSFAAYEAQLAEGGNNYRFVSKKRLLCEGEDIRTCEIKFASEPFTYDQHHLSLSATLYAGKKLKQQFPTLLELIE